MKIIIVGSMVYAKDMLDAKEKLEKNNHSVTVPPNAKKYVDGTMEVENKQEKVELDIFKVYFNKIKEGDAILVINKEKKGIPNYIGGNSLIDMAFAYVLDKKIFVLNDIPKMLYTDEIKAMRPICLNGDLEKVK